MPTTLIIVIHEQFQLISNLGQTMTRATNKLNVVHRGALHSLEIAYEIFSEQKDLYGFLMDSS